MGVASQSHPGRRPSRRARAGGFESPRRSSGRNVSGNAIALLGFAGLSFHPDFLAKLRNGTLLVVEYKGAHLAHTPETYEKEAIGQLWARGP